MYGVAVVDPRRVDVCGNPLGPQGKLALAKVLGSVGLKRVSLDMGMDDGAVRLDQRDTALALSRKGLEPCAPGWRRVLH